MLNNLLAIVPTCSQDCLTRSKVTLLFYDKAIYLASKCKNMVFSGTQLIFNIYVFDRCQHAQQMMLTLKLQNDN